MSASLAASRFLIQGRVQGVGYRYFAQKAAAQLNISGYARNLEDGSVEIYAVGRESDVSEFAGRLRNGPPFSEVRSVDRQEAAVERHSGFRIR
jgi:acylphosphatase